MDSFSDAWLNRKVNTAPPATAIPAISAIPSGVNGEKLLDNSENSENSDSRRGYSPETSWQNDFCTAHAISNNWRGCCPLSIDECLLSRILDADSDVEKLKGFSIGQGITTDDVIQWWNNAGESLMDLIAQPLWFICIAEYLHVEKRL